ncbi:sensor histidine kinase [Undibacterium pigrum]|uniref:histidine kinase n=1 Tax=Undibacterium pigrum TaxID=401470 RepID=A0A318J2Z1_9BURK|nr:sensor histidine kinase [Undibacterium pigrum]PXX42090.1 phospho-acceptor domain-containing protein [Undibacterium pigrum]
MTRLKSVGLIGLGLLLISLVTMAAWLSQNSYLVKIFSSSTAMVFPTAFCFFLAGLAFLLPLYFSPRTSLIRNIAGILIVIIAGLMLIENLFNVSLGIDLAAVHRWYSDLNPSPGRMAPNTALAFLAGGAGLLRTSDNQFYIKPRTVAAVMLTISVLGMVGYMLLLDLAYTWYGFPRMAFMTGFSMSMFACALMLERPEMNSLAKGESNLYVFLGVAVTVLVTTMFVSYGSLRAQDARNTWVEHTYEVKIISDEMAGYLARAGTANERHELDDMAGNIQIKMAELKQAISDNVLQRDRLANLEKLLPGALDTARQALAANAEAGTAKTRVGMAFSPLIQIMQQFRNTENQLLQQRKQESEQSTSSTTMVIILGNMLGFAMLLYAFWLLKRLNAQRSELELALQQANLDLELKVEERTSELGKLNQDLSGFNASLEQRVAERTADLESFSYSVSHDLRAPLRAIDGFGRMLEEDYGNKLDADALRYLSVIRKNSQRMGILIDDLLAFSRLGRQEVHKYNLDMTALVREVIQESLQQVEKVPEIKLEELPAAQADRALLKQAWLNLISNAIKYSSKSDNPSVQISGSVDGDHIVYSVKDNGVGFNMEYYDKLFGVFQRLHHASDFKGTGVGLAITQRVLTRHGGRIWAQSSVNEGASFFFSLPVGEQNG